MLKRAGCRWNLLDQTSRMRVNTGRVGEERKRELTVGDDEGRRESRGSRGKPRCGFSAGLWLPLAPPLHQSASTADSRSCNDLPLRPFCLPFFFLVPYTLKYSQPPSPFWDSTSSSLSKSLGSQLQYKTRSTPVSPHEFPRHRYSTVRVFLICDHAWSRRFPPTPPLPIFYTTVQSDWSICNLYRNSR